jgi:hypothetical protein
MVKIASRLRREVIHRVYVDRGGGPGDTIVLAGSGRSGTTWLSDVINFENGYRYLFEPFHPRYVPEWSAFPERPYFRPTERPDEVRVTVERILSGAIRNRWIDGFNLKVVARRRLLKDVRANLFLKWISVQFPEVPLVFVFRHPCAVALSQERGQNLRGSWSPDLESLLAQPALVDDHLAPFVDEIREACSMPLYEQLVFRWCIENYVPLRQFGGGGVHWIFYERACIEPEAEIRALFEYVQQPWNVRVLEVASRPSPMTAPESSIRAGGGLIDGWQRKIDGVRLDRTLEILSIFGLDRLYGAEPEPRIGALADCLGLRPAG